MRYYCLLTAFITLYITCGKLFAQLEYVPPIHAKVSTAQNLDGVLLLNTLDHNSIIKFSDKKTVQFGTPNLYPSTLQVIDPLNPWPPVFFTNAKPGGNDFLGNGMYIDFRYQDATGQLTFFLGKRTGKKSTVGSYYICDTSFSIVDSFPKHTSNLVDHHDFQINTQGEILYMRKVDTCLDISAYSKEVLDTSLMVTFQKIEIKNREGKLIFSWNPLEHIPISDTYLDYGNFQQNNEFTPGWDWSHANSARFAIDGNILYSFNHIGVGKINRKTGKLMWKLGGKSPTIPIPQGGEYYRQHDFHEISPGIYAVFSNGINEHSCKAIEYRINEKLSTATLVRIYEPEKSIFSLGMGNYDVEKSGLRIFNYGRYVSPDGRQQAFEIADASGKIQAVYDSPHGNFPYQVHLMSTWKPHQPAIVNENGILKLRSSKESEISWYKISDTAATLVGYSQNYKPKIKGTYVATVKKGFGWIVSKPYLF